MRCHERAAAGRLGLRGRSAGASLVTWLAVAALAVMGVSAVATSGPALGVPAGFVTRSGDQLLLDGEPYLFTGLNVYNANSRGWCWYDMVSGSVLDDSIVEMGPGAKVIRAWFFQTQATTGGVRDWSAFDHTLAVAAGAA
ncbi:MAG: hypothetical protein M5T61_05325 [Acidimicrobiia bacterium]|nr:hypothetical protein [Acidimicrobiia bacterium]